MVQEKHEEELQGLFNKLPVVTFNGSPTEINGETVKMITYPILVAISESLMAKAYHHGQMNAIEDVEKAMLSSFK
jgi:hypothetical protein